MLIHKTAQLFSMQCDIKKQLAIIEFFKRVRILNVDSRLKNAQRLYIPLLLLIHKSALWHVHALRNAS